MSVIEDIIAMNQGVMDRVRYDPRVISVEMIPDEDQGTIWLVHLDNGITLWSGVGLFDVATRHDGHYRVRPAPPPVPVEKDPMIAREIEVWIRRRHPEIDEWSFDDDIVIYGLVQSNKTEMILSMIWIGQNVRGIPCVLVLANMASSYNQVLGKNATAFNDMLLEEFGERARAFFIRTTGFRGCAAPTDDATDPAWLRVAMSNPAQLNRLINTTQPPFLLFCDEADVHVKACNDDTDTTSTGPLMKRLEEMAEGTVKITATPFALLNAEGAVQKTITMRTPKNYRGLSETEWVILSDADADAVRRGSAPRAIHLLDDMVGVLRPRVGGRYMSILVNAPSTIAGQDELARAIAARRPGWNVYAMNSGDGQTSIRRATATQMIPTGMETISSLYDKFERDDGFQINIIVAQMAAARAISFRPTSKRIGTGGLHGMIFFPSTVCHMAQMIQYMRVWGIYDEDYPRIMVQTTQHVYDRLHSEITHNLRALADATSRTGVSREQIEGVPVIDVGLHDRRAVDDTRILDRVSMLRTEFETRDEIEQLLDYDRFVVLTEEEPIRIPSDTIPLFVPEMIGTSGAARTIRRQLEDILPPHIPRTSLQISWNKARHEKLHHLPSRMTAGREYNPKAVVGLSGNVINVVIWKDAFRNLLISDLREDTAYLFLTTKGGWRYFTRTEKRRVGVLSHP